MGPTIETFTARVRGLVGRQSALEERVSRLEQQVDQLMETTAEDRRLHRRVAELVDVVEERLLRGDIEGDSRAQDDRGA